MLYFLLELHLAEISKPVVVNLRDTAILSCNSTCTGELLWTFKTSVKNLEVLRCVQDNCTERDGFKGRASLSLETTKHGRASLIINRVVYNDEGWYEASCDAEVLCDVHLDVLGRWFFSLVLVFCVNDCTQVVVHK